MTVAAEPAVSVLLPVRDAGDTLGECLDSIAAQSMRDFELVAVDDGSTDDSAAILAAGARGDARIRLLRGPRRGLVACLNEGLIAARAPLVARMDADDRMHPTRLERQLEHLRRHPGLDVLGTRVRAFPAERVKAGTREYLRWQNACLTCADHAEEIYVECPVAHPSVTYRRSTVLAAGGYRDGEFPEDYELWLRLRRAGRRLAKLAAYLLDWRQRGDSHSRADPRYAREAFDRLRAAYLAADPRLAGARPLAFWGAGRRTRRRAAHLLARGVRPSAWVDVDPRKIGNRVGGIPVVAPHWLARPERDEARPFVLVWVASHGARTQIARALEAMNYRRGHDYLPVG